VEEDEDSLVQPKKNRTGSGKTSWSQNLLYYSVRHSIYFDMLSLVWLHKTDVYLVGWLVGGIMQMSSNPKVVNSNLIMDNLSILAN
jgi:hypothetical protein